jgi:hypothetical protein
MRQAKTMGWLSSSPPRPCFKFLISCNNRISGASSPIKKAITFRAMACDGEGRSIASAFNHSRGT